MAWEGAHADSPDCKGLGFRVLGPSDPACIERYRKLPCIAELILTLLEAKTPFTLLVSPGHHLTQCRYTSSSLCTCLFAHARLTLCLFGFLVSLLALGFCESFRV